MEVHTLNENHGCDFMVGISLLKHGINSGFCFLHIYLGKEKVAMEEHF